jgi:hypothetical protein
VTFAQLVIPTNLQNAMITIEEIILSDNGTKTALSDAGATISLSGSNGNISTKGSISTTKNLTVSGDVNFKKNIFTD